MESDDLAVKIEEVLQESTQKIEPADFAVQIEEVLAEVTTEYECVMLDENEIGVFWTFILEDTISGYIAVEDNEEALDFKTISIGIHIKDITDITKDELLDIFEINGELINANFTVVKHPVKVSSEPEMEFVEEGEDLEYDENEGETEFLDLLIIQTRVPFETFAAEDFEAFVNNLMFQADLFLNNSEDGEEGNVEIL